MVRPLTAASAVTVYLVGAGPGDPGLLTRRGAALLARADVVLFDRLVDPLLLALAPPGALRLDVGKQPGEPRHQDEVNALLLEHGRSGVTVVRLKGGDPFVFGRGGEEAQCLAAAGIDYEVVPGVSSAFAVPAAAGTPVTHRGLSSSVTVVTGHVGPPGAPGAVDWAALARAGGTIVILMGMAGREEIARRLTDGGMAPDTPVLVVQRGTTRRQAEVRTTLDRLGQVELGAPCTIVVGSVAALDLRSAPPEAPGGGPPPPGPLAGATVVVTRAPGRNAALQGALEAAGAAVLAVPVIAVADAPDGGAALRAEAAQVSRYGWVLFTSANAVERFMDAVADVRVLADVRVAAVGEATAAALAARHLPADLVPRDPSAQGLADALLHRPAGGGPAEDVPTPTTALFPRALEARAVLAPALRAGGWDVTEVVAYATVAAGAADGLTPDALRAAASADAVIFTAPSTVRRFVELVGVRGVPPAVVCIGSATAEAARGAGLVVAAVAKRPDVEHLVQAVGEALAPGRGPGRPA